MGTPLLEVHLVTLGSGEVAPASGEEEGAGGSPAMAAPAAENATVPELLPPEQAPAAVEKPREKDPKPPVNLAAARPRPVSKPKEPSRVTPPSKETPEAVASSVAPALSADAGAAGAAPAQSLGESGESGSGGGIGTHGKGFHRGHGGGPVDAEFGAADGPRFVHRKMPQYPRLARQLGKEGIVVLRVTIDEGGRPIAVETIKSAGCGFDEEAMKAVQESLFHPAKREGKPVICRAILPIRFELRGPD